LLDKGLLLLLFDRNLDFFDGGVGLIFSLTAFLVQLIGVLLLLLLVLSHIF